jgi:hypothetical protein
VVSEDQRQWQRGCGESSHCVEVSYDEGNDEILVRSNRSPGEMIRLTHDEWMDLRFSPVFRVFPGGADGSSVHS